MNPSAPLSPPPAPLPTLLEALASGGDARIAVDPLSGLNAYGCSLSPGAPLLAFGSSTASTLSQRGFAAVQALYADLALSAECLGREAAALDASDRLRSGLARLCGLEDLACSIILASSGTDLHLIAVQVLGSLPGSGPPSRDAPSGPLAIVTLESGETGSGVPAALLGRHPGAKAALAGPLPPGERLEGACAVSVTEIPGRDADARVPEAAALDARFAEAVERAVGAGQRTLLIVSDLSKTGLLAPSPSCALALKRRHGASLEVLVDACQFRLAPSTLGAYVRHGCWVALTGSKAVTGPAFSGALVVPPGPAERFRRNPLPRGLAAYSARADWPQGWEGRSSLPQAANLGLLLRWEAALAELKAFSGLEPGSVDAFFKTFGEAVRGRLAKGDAFEALECPNLDRGAEFGAPGWDRRTTVFPFLLKKGRVLPPRETGEVYRRILALPAQMGQAVPCGTRQGARVSALRLCASMRLAVDALAPGGRGGQAVVSEALTLLDLTAGLF